MKLSYKDDKDKCYGATGMAMGVVIFDGEEMLTAVDLDADPHDMLQFSEDFYFSGNPGLSARAAWHKIVNNFNISMGVALSNILCRTLVMGQQRSLANETREALRQLMLEEGKASCELEEDEINSLFNKNYAYLNRVFSHRGVQGVAHDFAETLATMRRMSRAEVIEQLRALNML